jgi:branched-subunit amino acid ABC-type transport system permease component
VVAEPILLQFDLTSLLRTLLLGLQLGMTLALIVSGLTIIFGLMEVINLAHGSLYMLGAYFGVVLLGATGNFWLAVLLAPLLVGFVGVLLEVFTVRPLYGRNPLYHILLTLGLAFIIEEVVEEVWGATALNFPTPPALGGTVDLVFTTYPSYRLFLLVASGLLLLGISVAFQRTHFGVLLQASGRDPEMVEALGVDVTRLFTVVFFVAAVLAGLAGVLLGPIRAVSPTMWFNIVILAFAIIVIGGLGSFRGGIVGSVLVGLINAFGSLVFPSLTDMLVFVLMAVVLIVRPSGLFGIGEVH